MSDTAVGAADTPAALVEERASDVVDLPSTSRTDFVEKAWRFFCSLKLMVALMALFALAMAGNTFINPQEDALVEIERGFADRPWIVALYRLFELYAPFKSWWFTLIILLLALNNLASSIERLPRIFLIVRNPSRLLTSDVLRGMRNKRSAPRGELTAQAIEQQLKSDGYAVSSVEQDGVTHLFAERGSWTRFGVWVVHIALMVICFGGIVGRMLAFEGTMDIPEHGGAASFFREKLPDGTVLTHRLNYSVVCDDFHLDKFKDGAARRFASDLRVVDRSGETVLKKRIIVNDPLDYDGKTFYQASYSERPDLSRAKLTVFDRDSKEKKEFRATPEEPVAPGDGQIRYRVERHEEAFGELGPAIQLVREELPPKDAPEGTQPKMSSFWVFERYPEFDQLRGDKYALQFGGLEPLYVTGIQVGYDPGVDWVYFGCFLMWGGLFVTFWTTHRRMWARVEGDKVTFAGAAHRNKDKFKAEFDALLERLGVGTPVKAQS